MNNFNRRNFLKMGTSALVGASLPTFLSNTAAAGVAENPSLYLQGIYRPTSQENLALEIKEIRGEIPKDLEGYFLQNGSNPQFMNFEGPYHWFDGDGMIHMIHFKEGKAFYSNRFTRTKKYKEESLHRGPIYGGLMTTSVGRKAISYLTNRNFVENTSNTDFLWFRANGEKKGRLLSLWYLGDTPYEISLPQLETKGLYNFNQRLKRSLPAHPKIDVKTNEVFFTDHCIMSQDVRIGKISANGVLTYPFQMQTHGLCFFHDMAITENYILLFNPPYGPDVNDGGMSVRKNEQTQFLAISRHDFSVKRFYWEPASFISHTVNAWESADGRFIHLTTSRMGDPKGGPKETARRFGIREDQVPMIDKSVFAADLYQWRFDLQTGETKGEILDNRLNDFPSINENFQGRQTRYSYVAINDLNRQFRFNSIMKYDLQDISKSKLLSLGRNSFGGEGSFCPRPNAVNEDDGYFMHFIYQNSEGQSEFRIYDASQIESGAICRLILPVRVPMGAHTSWIPETEITGT